MVCGGAGCPEWGTLFAEIEDDAREVGLEFIRRLMRQTATQQAQTIPAEERTIETESGSVNWNEPKACLPKSREAFFPSVEGLGTGS